jgi:hypothetical protein
MDKPTITTEQRLVILAHVEEAAVLEQGVSAGRIPNASLVAARTHLSDGFQVAMSRIMNPLLPKRDDGKDGRHARKVHEGLYPTIGNLRSIVAKLRAATGEDAAFAPALTVAEAFLPLDPMLAYAKDIAVKKGSVQAEREVPPKPPESDAAKAVRKVLVDFTERSAQALIEMNMSRILGTLKSYLDAQTKAVDEGKRIEGMFLHDHFTRSMGRYGRHVDDKGIDLVSALTEVVRKSEAGTGFRIERADSHAIARKAAEQHARKIQEAFVEKNVAKIGPLCDGMGSVPSVSEGRTEVAIEALSGEIVVKFADGSGFTARNGITWNVSSQGTHFTQYPLRFHEVTFPDGGKAKFVSEADMRKGFAPLSAEA